MAKSLTLDALGQSQSSLHIPTDGLQTFLELLITVMFLTATGVIAAIMLVTAFSHRRNTYIKLKNNSKSVNCHIHAIYYFGSVITCKIKFHKLLTRRLSCECFSPSISKNLIL